MATHTSTAHASMGLGEVGRRSPKGDAGPVGATPAAMAKEDWPKARELLLKVWNEKNTYDVAASLGQVEFKLEHYGAAARYMSFALDNVAPSEKAEFIERLKKGLREVRLRVASIRVTVNEPGAEILAGDEVIGASPLAQEVFLDPGRHVLLARKGERTAKADVLAKAGEAFEVPLSLPAEPPPAAPTSGLGAASPPGVSSEHGAPGDMATPESRSVVPVIVGGGVAVASLVTGIVLRVSANGSYDEAKELRRKNGPMGCATGTADPADCSAQTEANDSGDTKANVSTAAFAVAGGALLATAAYWFWPRQRAASAMAPAPRFQASATPTSGFFSVTCDF